MRASTLLYIMAIANAFSWPWEDDLSTTTSLLSAAATLGSSSATSAGTDALEDYVPKLTACPDFNVIREAESINSEEKAYVSKRQDLTLDNLVDFLSNVANLLDFDAKKFMGDASKNITIGLAYSGGGYRAMLSGAGELLALDNRFENLTKEGLGGLLQSATYITGLSGGSWLLGTLVLNDWISVGDILDPDSGIWNLDDLIFNPSGINVVNTVKYYNAIRTAVDAKDDAGFETSVTDVWGRALSYQFFNPDLYTDGGANLTWSGVRNNPSFKNHSLPFPIVVADGRMPGTMIINENATVFEISPYELGSWDPSLRSFADIRYVGTNLYGGKSNDSQCVTNLDNAGYVLGTSLSLFNQALLRVESSTDLNSAVQYILKLILQPFSDNDVDIATWLPNPFRGTSYGNSLNLANENILDLVDGGEDGQNVPLAPLIQNKRKLDVIFAFDNSADTDQNWPNGTSLVHTFGRQFSPQGKGSPFPYVPLADVFVSEGLNERPTFFGCDAKNLSDLIDYHNVDFPATDIPLVVYMPNNYQSYEGNTSTFKMSYDRDEVTSVIQNGFEVSLRGNFSDDSDWAKCVGCAIIRREQERKDDEQLSECANCFQKYCWQGLIEDTPQELIGPERSGLLTESSSQGSQTSLERLSTQVLSSQSATVAGQSTSASTSLTSSNKNSVGSRQGLDWAMLVLGAVALF